MKGTALWLLPNQYIKLRENIIGECTVTRDECTSIFFLQKFTKSTKTDKIKILQNLRAFGKVKNALKYDPFKEFDQICKKLKKVALILYKTNYYDYHH